MDPKLVLSTALRNEPKESNILSQGEEFNFGERVRRTFHDLLAIPRVSGLNPVRHLPTIPVGSIGNMCKGQILPLDHPFAKEPVVLCTRIPLNGDQEKARRSPVESMHRRKVCQPG